MPTIKLSEHFTLQEFIYSETAAREGIDNTPSMAVIGNLQVLAQTMERVRSICGANPITITSGYRSPKLNAAIGGSTTSAHMSGLACDFIVPGYGDPYDVCKELQVYLEALKVDQLIWEYGDWVHLGLALPPAVPRLQCLTITSAGTIEGIA